MLMSSLIKSSVRFDVQMNKEVAEESFQIIDDQTRWIEQKLTMKVDNKILDQYIQCQKEVQELERMLEVWKR